MKNSRNLEVQEKKELTSKEEITIPGKYYLPQTDIYETADALMVVMELPGINKDAVDIRIEKDELAVRAELDLSNYENYRPVYTEYNVGHFTRSFTLSHKVDRDKIEANVNDGVLFLNLPKLEEARPKRITVN